MARSIGEVYVSVEANTRKFTAKTKRDAATAGFFAAEKFEDSWDKRLNRSNAIGAWLARALPQATKWGTRTGAAWSKRFGSMADKAHIDFNRYVDDAAQSATATGRTWRSAFQRSIGDLRILGGAAAAKIAQQFQRLGFRAAFQFRRGVKTGPSVSMSVDPDVADSFLAGVATGKAFQRGMQTIKASGINLAGLSPAEARIRGEAYGRQIGDGIEDGVGATRRGAQDGNRYARAFNMMARSKMNPSNWFANSDRTVRAVFLSLLVAGGPLVSLISSLSAGLVAFAAAAGVAATAVGGSLVPIIGAVIPAIAVLGIGISALREDAKGVSPAVKEMAATFKKEWQGLRNVVANNLFTEVAPQAKAITASLKTILAPIATSVGGVLSSIGTAFSALPLKDLAAAFDPLIRGLGGLLASTLQPISQFMLTAAPAGERLIGIFGKIVGSFSEWINSVDGQKGLTKFLTNGLNLLEQFGKLLGPLLDAFGNVFGAAVNGPAQALLGLLTDLAKQFQAFTADPKGQKALASFFDSIGLAIGALEPVIKGLAEGLSRMVTPASAKALLALGEAIGALLPLVGTLFNALAESGIVQVVAEAFTKLAGILVSSGLVDAVGRLASALGDGLAAVLPSVMSLLDGLFKVIIPIADAVGALLVPIMEALAPVIAKVGEVLTKLAPKFGELMEGLVLLITPLLEPLAEVFLAVADNLDLLNPLMDLVVGILRDLGPVLIPLVKLFAELLKGVATGITLFGTIAGKIIEVAQGFADWLLKSEPVKKAMEVISGAVDGVTGAIKTAVGWISDLVSALGNIKMPDVIGNIRSTLKDIPGVGNLFAEGGLVFGPTRAIIGEAGPEAVIPLTRPLSQIDPSVRQMAAMLRGQHTVTQPKVVTATGPSRTNIVYVQATQADPEAVAYSVANRLAAQAG